MVNPVAIAKSGITKTFRALGIEAAFAKRKEYTDFVFFDRNAIESFYHKDEYIRRYYEGLQLTGMEATDNFFKQSRSYTLQQLLKQALKKGLNANVAECGCWKGHSSYIISSILSENNFSGEFCIFDSFEGGLSEKCVEDENVRISLSDEEVQREKQIFASAENDLHRVLKHFDFYKLYKGWIPERFNEVENDRFMFVHLDVDLYQPTLDGLNFFYPRLERGGVIVVDDYGYTQFPGAKKSVDEFLEKNECSQFMVGLAGGCFIVK